MNLTLNNYMETNVTFTISNFTLPDIIDSVISTLNVTDVSDNTTSLNSTVSSSIEIQDDVSTQTTTPGTKSTGKAFYITMMCVFTPGACANTLAAYCLAKDVSKKHLVKQLLIALCIIDILGLCTIAFHHAIMSFVDNPPVVLCSFNSFLSGFLPLMSGALTAMMALERCIKFRAPFWHNVNIWSWKVKVPIILTTVILMTVALFPMSGLGYIVSQDSRRTCRYFPSEVIKMYNSPQGIYTISYAAVGLVTVFVDVFGNVAVIFTMIGMKGKRAEMSESGEGKTAEMAMTRMLFWLSATFLLTLSPLYVSLVILYSGTPLSQGVKIFTHLLAGLSFTLDPFIYLIMMKTYRRRIINLLCCCWEKHDTGSSCGRSYPVATPNSCSQNM